MDVVFEEVEERVGECDGAVLGGGGFVWEGERGGGLVAGGEGDVLEVSVGVGDLALGY